MKLDNMKAVNLQDAQRVIQMIEERVGRASTDTELIEALTAGETALLLKASQLQNAAAAKSVEIASQIFAQSEEYEAELDQLLAEVQARATKFKQIKTDAKTQLDDLSRLLWNLQG